MKHDNAVYPRIGCMFHHDMYIDQNKCCDFQDHVTEPFINYGIQPQDLVIHNVSCSFFLFEYRGHNINLCLECVTYNEAHSTILTA